MNTMKRSQSAQSTGPAWWILQTASWMLLLSIAALLIAMIGLPRVTGATPYTVLTGSMRPEMPPGSLVVSKPLEAGKLKVGDAITYQIRSGEPEVVTHRIISLSQTLGGETLFTTQGDANPGPDERPVNAAQIRGVVWYSIPLVGYVNSWLTGEQRIWAVGITAALLLGYAVFMCSAAVVETRRSKQKAAPGPATVNADEGVSSGAA
ncbi:S26 family signal peptidase [Pseudarthrobacter sulfonivorans]|uniref:Signal peptidase I n=1 Tax=Pseudarthrobacter sulfonivorans TaxID=121292 RepID=A0A0U3QSQ7_9MICC|nr:signal peptidase I [Pseudarthrobacter sulfonivorans]ALV42645.1 S26 family signal peptidase [Pseudarthrobacter sulfonivorans]